MKVVIKQRVDRREKFVWDDPDDLVIEEKGKGKLPEAQELGLAELKRLVGPTK